MVIKHSLLYSQNYICIKRNRYNEKKKDLFILRTEGLVWKDLSMYKYLYIKPYMHLLIEHYLRKHENIIKIIKHKFILIINISKM